MLPSSKDTFSFQIFYYSRDKWQSQDPVQICELRNKLFLHYSNRSSSYSVADKGSIFTLITSYILWNHLCCSVGNHCTMPLYLLLCKTKEEDDSVMTYIFEYFTDMVCIIMKLTNVIIFPIRNQKHYHDYGTNSIYI